MRVTKGASTAAWPRPIVSAVRERCAAATFSADMRRYSAGEQVPCAIIIERRMIVSQDATANWLIMTDRANGEVCGGFFIDHNMSGPECSHKWCCLWRYIPPNRRQADRQQAEGASHQKFLALMTLAVDTACLADGPV